MVTQLFETAHNWFKKFEKNWNIENNYFLCRDHQLLKKTRLGFMWSLWASRVCVSELYCANMTHGLAFFKLQLGKEWHLWTLFSCGSAACVWIHLISCDICIFGGWGLLRGFTSIEYLGWLCGLGYRKNRKEMVNSSFFTDTYFPQSFRK